MNFGRLRVLRARWMVRRCLMSATFCVVLLSTRSIAVVGENAVPQAEWISVTPTADAGQIARFRKTFTVAPNLVKAVLLGACDERMAVFINGTAAGDIGGYDRAISLDVTPHLRDGQNVIALRVEHSDGLAAARIILELANERGRQSWIASDSTWQCSLNEDAGWQDMKFSGCWAPAVGHGSAGLARWGDAFDAVKSVDAYNSWMLASGAPQATDPKTINVPPGYRVELLRSAQPNEGSWIALALDPQGRITVSREQRGLLRMTLGAATVEKVEVIEDTLQACRGLLYAHDALYVNANDSKGFFRLRDTDHDDHFDEKTLLLAVDGGVGHGRNQLRLGPDGLIYLAQGNDVEQPANVAKDSPLRHTAADQLFPLRWGEHGTTKGILPPHGHILQTDRDGSFWRVLAGGLRNQLDVDFNEDGELFTYDADNERDIAAPWYRPTRVLHVTSGAEFGWRIGAGKLPAYLPDTLPSVVDVGVGSPCGVEFGARSNFSPRHRRALFIADWSYGRILAIHLEPDGASYRGTIEPFVSGRPLNVTDMAIGRDGAMYFTTGGRKTQSGLYRVTSSGPASADPPVPIDRKAAELRALRRNLERFHGREIAGAVEAAWPHLGHHDRFIRYAARVAVEAQPLAQWIEKAFAERDSGTALPALLAVARVGAEESQPRLLSRLQEFSLSALDDERRLVAARICEVSCARMGRPSEELATKLQAYFEPIYPAKITPLNHELCRLLIYLGSPRALETTVALAGSARASEDLLHYLWHLRHIRAGWNIEQRRIAFDALARAEKFQGAREYSQALRDIRKDFLDALTPAEREQLGSLIAPAPTGFAMPSIDWSKFAFRKSWKIEDFSPDELARSGNPAQGLVAFAAAQCIQCHRFDNAAGGQLGPDLVAVSARFGRRDLLRHILEPSLAIDDKYRNTVVTLKSGATYAGFLQEEDDEQLRLATGANPDDVIALDVATVAKRETSPVSPMPPALVNILTKEQIIDLLTYLESPSAPR